MFTVVIPLYNKEKYILNAVNSVLHQNFKDFELLIVNDGSTDNSLEELKNINDNRLKIVNQFNQGVGAARNKGFENAKYDWIALLDADDYWSPDHLTELNKIIHKYPSTRMVATQNIIIDINSQDKQSFDDGNKFFAIRKIDYFLEASKKLTIVHSSSVAINKRVYTSIGGFSHHSMGEDLEYWARIALSYDVAISEKATSCYCIGTGGATSLSDKNDYVNSRARIKSLDQVSPTFKLLIDKSNENKNLLKRRSIRSYINSSLYSGVKIWVYHGNFRVAKDLASLALPQITTKYILLYVISNCPSKLLQGIKIAYKKIKNIN